MKKSTIIQLDQLNQNFYQETAKDFAASRWQGWPGWKKLLPYFEQKAATSTTINVLDVGCGSGRLARFLHHNLMKKSEDSHKIMPKNGYVTQTWKILKRVQDSSLSLTVQEDDHEDQVRHDDHGNQAGHDDIEINYLGLDRSLELLDISTKLTPKQSSSWQATFAQINLVNSLLNNSLIKDLQNLSTNQPDIICLFAVTHHIPSFKLRQRLIANLAEFLAPNGLLMICSWQFLNAHKQRDRLIDPNTIGLDPTDWEENDFIMDWRAGEEITYRYCHYMNNDEEVAILKTIDLQAVDEFFADGITRNMNHYLVLKKN